MSDPQKLATAPTHVPPPRTAFLEHCEVEIYEGLTYVRLDDVMHLLSEGAPSEQQVERAAKALGISRGALRRLLERHPAAAELVQELRARNGYTTGRLASRPARRAHPAPPAPPAEPAAAPDPDDDRPPGF